MPPRKTLDIKSSPMRRDLLREYALTESEVTRLRKLPLADALWQIGHEANVHIIWARRRAEFLENEVRQASQPLSPNGIVVASVVEFVQPHQPEPRGYRV